MAKSSGFVASYLEGFMERLSPLPSSLRGQFALMRDLDSRVQELKANIEKNQKVYFAALRRAYRDGRKPPSEEALEAIRKDIKTANELSDQKIALAMKAHEMVDEHIRKLDSDLPKVESALKVHPGDSTPEPSTSLKRPAASEAAAPRARRRKLSQSTTQLIPATYADNVDAVETLIDPNEPRYCYCRGVSFGQMVGCDNPECKIEWFHFGCVGLKSTPKGKWLCPDCRRKRNLQKQ